MRPNENLTVSQEIPSGKGSAFICLRMGFCALFMGRWSKNFSKKLRLTKRRLLFCGLGLCAFLFLNSEFTKKLSWETSKAYSWENVRVLLFQKPESEFLAKWSTHREHVGFFLNRIKRSKIFKNYSNIDGSSESEKHSLLVDYIAVDSNENLTNYFNLKYSDRLQNFHQIFKLWINSTSEKSKFQLNFTLNHPQLCSENEEHVLLVAIASTASHGQYRTAIRDTWGGYAYKMGAVVLFFVGVPLKSKYHSQLAAEDMKFHDVIQMNFLDTYRNLSYKTLSMLRWKVEFCPQVKYVLKVDDDMFINVDNFLSIARQKNITNSIIGELAHKWTPVRCKTNKWYASYKEYPFKMYPDFVFGPSYMITGDSIDRLYETSKCVSLFHLEDVYVTGFLAEISNVTRRDQAGIFNVAKDLQPCNYNKLFSSHGHTPPDMYRHWLWLQRRNFKCAT